MKKIFLTLGIIFLLTKSGISAEPTRFGLGIVLGEPTGISFKYWQNEKFAFDGAIAWSFGKPSAFHLHGNYLLHTPLSDIYEQPPTILLYYGIGLRAQLFGDNHLGIRFPLGLTVLLKPHPFDLFLEIVPIFNLFPATELDFNAGLGFRFYF